MNFNQYNKGIYKHMLLYILHFSITLTKQGFEPYIFLTFKKFKYLQILHLKSIASPSIFASIPISFTKAPPML